MMKNVDDYLGELFAQQPHLPSRSVALGEALGAVTAQPVRAQHPIPLFDNSAMDGYALYYHDVVHASATSPVRLPVIADIPAGATTPVDVPPGAAARIMTGAPMPTGADLIVPVEETNAGVVEVEVMGQGGEFIREAGEDVQRGDIVVDGGVRITARHIASIAAAGHGRVSVYAKPRVAVISTGTELKNPGEPLEFGQIPNSNSAMVAASLAGEAQVVDHGAVADDVAELRSVLDSIDADAVILTGGVSVGAYDVVKELLAPQPGMWFGPVAMQPGKPQGFGTYNGMSVFTLPGNPVSVYVSLHMLVRPALAYMCGLANPRPVFRKAVAGQAWGCPPGRVQFIPVRVTGQDDHGCVVVEPASEGGSGSHLIGTLAMADGLARIEADVGGVAVGDQVKFWEER